MVELTHKPGDVYLIIGTNRRGKRYRLETENPYYALGHNMYRATLYRVRGTKRTPIYRWFN